MKCKQRGFFLDVAANDALHLSNTRMLERDLGWDGVCIEPNPQYWPGLALRRCSVVGALLGNVTGAFVKYVSYHGDKGKFSGIVGKEFDIKRVKNDSTDSTKEPTVRIGDVLDFVTAPKTIDYFSFDIEGAETLVATAFPWVEHPVMVMTVERPKRDAIALFKQGGLQFLRTNTFFDQTWISTQLDSFKFVGKKYNNSINK